MKHRVLKRGKLPVLSAQEWKLMELLWTKSPQPAYDLIEALAPREKWHPNTVRTMLARLMRKGIVRAEPYKNLYLYSAGITPRLLDVVAREPRVLRYLDMPIQHASDTVLERMRRPERRATIREKVARFRDAVPGLAIRTTCIVGFPGVAAGSSNFAASVNGARSVTARPTSE